MGPPSLQPRGTKPTPAAAPFLSSPFVESCVVALCLAALAIRFYLTAGRFLDQDEIYFFHLAHAVSRGAGLYAELETYYPPLLFYLGAAFFALFHDLYSTLLGARIFVITLGLAGFFLVLTVFRRLRLIWFAIPATFFALYLTQFDLKLMEFRGDNVLCLIVVAQSWLLFELNEGTQQANLKCIGIALLGVLAFHLNQKALFVEPPVLVAFVITRFSHLRRLIRRRWVPLGLAVLLVAALAAFSPRYHRFVYRTYIDTLPMVRVYPAVGGWNFLLACLKRNVGYWLLAVLSAILLAYGSRIRPQRYLPPLLLLLGACALPAASPFPFLHYQLYATWAALFALPFAARIASDLSAEVPYAPFAVCAMAAASSLLTYQSFQFPHQPLRAYATMVDRARQAIGAERVAFVGGTLITADSVWPQDAIDGAKQYKEYVVDRRWNMREILRRTETKLVFNARDSVRDQATTEDRVFVGLNYAETAVSPLLIASRWHWLDASRAGFQIDAGGAYRTWVFPENGDAARIDGQPAGRGAVLSLDQGTHTVESGGPGVLMTEFAAPTISSVEYRELADARRSAFKHIDADFSGAFRLLGVLRLEGEDADVYRFFWQKIGSVDADLWAFHHFRDAAGQFVHGENVDPGGGWYALREIDAGQFFSYGFRVAKSLREHRLEVGLYYRDEIARRVPYGQETYYTLDLSTLRSISLRFQ